MINCSFTDNRAVGNWSGTVPAGVVIVTDTIGGNGGAMVWRGSLGDIDYCNFTSNTALYLGGAIHLRYNTNVTFRYCNFTRNHAGVVPNGVTVNDTVTMSGGAIYFNTGAVNCTIISSTFEDNIAETNGGALTMLLNVMVVLYTGMVIMVQFKIQDLKTTEQPVQNGNTNGI